MKHKIQNGSGKITLKDVIRRYLPSVMFDRPKMSFSVPTETWLKGNLYDWAESLLDERYVFDIGILEAKVVYTLWSKSLAGKRRHHRPIWNFSMVQAWAD